MTKGSVEDVGAVMAGLVISTYMVKIMRYNRQLAHTILEYIGKEGFEIKSLFVGGFIKEINRDASPVIFFFKKLGVVLLIAVPFIIATAVMFVMFKPLFNVQLLIASVGVLFLMFISNAIVEPLLAVCELTEKD